MNEATWRPCTDDKVRWPREYGPKIWIVESIDGTLIRITAQHDELGHDVTRIAPLAELELASSPRKRGKRVVIPMYEDDLPEPVPPQYRLSLAEEDDLRDSPLAPLPVRRELDELADGLLFSETCLAYYRRRFHSRVPMKRMSNMIRNEIRKHGYVVKPTPRGMYACISTKRFRIHLNRRPTYEEPVTVDMLHPEPRRRRRRKRDAA